MEQQVECTRRPSRLQYGLLGAWLALFAANFALHDSRGLAAVLDAFKYLIPAANFVAGRGYTYLGQPHLLFPPGYGLTVMPLYLAGFELIEAALIINVIGLVLACMFTYLICRFYASRTMALVAILFVVMNAYIMDYATVALTEMTFMAAISGAGYFVLRFIRQPKPNPFNLIVASGFAGWATLIRPEGMGIALALVGFLWIDLLLRQAPPRFRFNFVARMALYALIFAAPLTVIYAPYVTFLSKHVGHFTLTSKSDHDIRYGNAELLEDGSSLDKYLYIKQGTQSTLADDIRRTRTNLVRHVKFAIKENLAVLTALCLVLAAGAWRDRLRQFPVRLDKASDLWEALGFCAFMTSPLLPMSFYLANPRYVVPYSPFVIIAAVVLMERIIPVRPSTGRPVGRTIFGAAVAAPLVLLGAYSNITMSRTKLLDYPLQTAAVALASLTDMRPVNVMTLSRPDVASYYANDRRILPDAYFATVAPDVTADQLVETMRSKGLQYLILDRAYIDSRPEIASLWTCPPGACPASLRLAAEQVGRYRIFGVMPEQAGSALNTVP
ncbi:MAG TPA: glycosyltransferase family 39 protein [Dongiaceae bacterium]